MVASYCHDVTCVKRAATARLLGADLTGPATHDDRLASTDRNAGITVIDGEGDPPPLLPGDNTYELRGGAGFADVAFRYSPTGDRPSWLGLGIHRLV